MKTQSNPNINSVDFDALSSDQRAFIYQHTELLQPYLVDDSSLVIKVDLVSEQNKRKGAQYKITLALKNGEQEIRARSNESDFFSAVQEASSRLIGALTQLHNEVVTSQERDEEIRAARQVKYLH